MLYQSATAVALLASFVAAQTNTTIANTTVNIGSLPLTLKSSWCQAQINTCGTLCSGRTQAGKNTCVEETLAYTCLCSSNSSTPGLQYYVATVPTFLCEQTFSDCNSQNVGNKAGQDACAQDRATNCGKIDPSSFQAVAPTTTSSAAASNGATGKPTSSAASGAATVASTSSRADAMPTMIANFGSGVVAAGVAAAFGLLL